MTLLTRHAAAIRDTATCCVLDGSPDVQLLCIFTCVCVHIYAHERTSMHACAGGMQVGDLRRSFFSFHFRHHILLGSCVGKPYVAYAYTSLCNMLRCLYKNPFATTPFTFSDRADVLSPPMSCDGSGLYDTCQGGFAFASSLLPAHASNTFSFVVPLAQPFLDWRMDV